MNYIPVYNSSLKQYNTLRLESKAHLVLFPLNAKGIQEIFQKYNGIEIIILGKGSNILLSKEYYNEDYVFINFKLMDNLEMIEENKIKVEAGTSLSRLSWFAVENNISGLEFLEDVPGSVGGALIMNAGTYEDTIGQLTEEITYYDIENDKLVTEETEEKDFGRRRSKWGNNNNIILSCVLVGQPGDYLKILEKQLLIKKTRYMKQPRNYPNAGSVFKRPSLNGVDHYVWKLFDEVGLRGYKKNGAMISEKHPGFIVNIDRAKYEDVIYLINLAKEKVKSNFGINLELEWKII